MLDFESILKVHRGVGLRVDEASHATGSPHTPPSFNANIVGTRREVKPCLKLPFDLAIFWIVFYIVCAVR